VKKARVGGLKRIAADLECVLAAVRIEA